MAKSNNIEGVRVSFTNELFGAFMSANGCWYMIGTAVLVFVLGFTGAPLFLWTILGAAVCVLAAAPMPVLIVYLAIMAVFNIKPLRRALVSSFVMNLLIKLKFLPVISETEKIALEAGVVWAEGELFSGKPDFRRLMNEPYPRLTAEEQKFIDGPTEKLCAMINDWEIWKTRDIPPAVWDFIRKERFLGMIIPKEYGGLGFSAMAHSEVIMKLSSQSVPASISVMVPNSLGPAELLIHYGTDEQKKRLLPRLAAGEETPCFALTEPGAGSDAGSITADGVVFKGEDGKLYVKLNWNKRWITLAAISTILGLAFKLRDPQKLLGKGEDLGITCALIPSNTPGVVIGRRHDPLGVPFYNCPTQGHDVVVDLEKCVVGGVGGCGHGWQMLMECLAAGRGISLPGQSAGGTKVITRVASAHASIRKQFGLSIGVFEGIEEPLARIAGFNYMLEAMRRYTLGALDQGLKPPVITAMAKYCATEISRKAINDGMDILGGAGISCGPRNTLAHLYIATPIGITVEGANILTRTLIIFGQGALRAHPFAFKEVKAIEEKNAAAFDEAFWGHIGHVVRNAFRSICLSWTRGLLAPSPYGGSTSIYYRKLAWASASFAIMSDIAMGSLGGKLKAKQMITGRFADILSWMYIGTSVLRRYQDEQKAEDLAFVHFTLNHALYEIQKGFDGIFANLEVPGLTWLFRGPIRWWSNLNAIGGESSDKHTHKIASMILQDSEQRLRHTEGIYVTSDRTQAMGRLEFAFKAVKKAEAIDKRIREARNAGTLPRKKGAELVAAALEKRVITQEEFDSLREVEKIRYDAIQVDDFAGDYT